MKPRAYITGKGVLYALAIVLQSASMPTAARAESQDSSSVIPICTGFDATRNSWGATSECPADSAFMSHDSLRLFSVVRPTDVPVFGYCCPLPRGVLTNDHVYVDRRCPDSFIATGSRSTSETLHNKREVHEYQVRCTRIDTSKYTLDTSSTSTYLGWSREYYRERLMPLMGLTQHYSAREKLPVALRYGVLRASWREWRDVGCVGYPWGSVLIGVAPGECAGLSWAQIRLKTPTGLPGAPLKTYEDCDALDDMFSPTPKCIKNSPTPK